MWKPKKKKKGLAEIKEEQSRAEASAEDYTDDSSPTRGKKRPGPKRRTKIREVSWLHQICDLLINNAFFNLWIR